MSTFIQYRCPACGARGTRGPLADELTEEEVMRELKALQKSHDEYRDCTDVQRYGFYAGGEPIKE
jgi:hypothetical protein